MNRLANSTSPYLLQHAHNPVDWYEWSAEAFQSARQEDKPILVSIGYSSCHWCHVMERESFENTDIAQIMNANFVCIKVDREERPDVDHIYMEAVQAMGMNGGWPLNVFLTPDQKPFYGGTYFPPRNWAALLINIGKTYKEKKNEILESAEDLKNHLNTNDVNRFATSTGNLDLNDAHQVFNILRNKYDSVFGGLNKAPKFIMPSIWEFLLRYHYITKNEQALQMVEHTLTMIACGGIFDQLGGGFARYSVDGQWFAPHFEKMLYDNGQLLSLYSEAYTISGNSLFKETLTKTIDWIERDMTHPEGGFYSALDADSDGTEGKYYVWTWDEVKAIAEKDFETAALWFNLKESGNWEHGVNILTRPDAVQEFSETYKITEPDLNKIISTVSNKLLIERAKRIKPGLDDKILLGWNAMMIIGLVDASLSLADERPMQMALQAIKFLEKNLIENEIAFRSFKGKHSATPAFLEDYAFLIKAYIKIYQATFDESYLYKSKQWTEFAIRNFYDPIDGYFLFSSKTSEKLIASKKEIFDNVIPSGNSVMARNLLMLADYFSENSWHETALNMIQKLSGLFVQEPAYMANWAMAFLESIKYFDEIVLSGKNAKTLRREFSKIYTPFALFSGSDTASNLPLLEGRDPKDNLTWIYVCRNKTCRLPVNNIVDALKELQN